MQHSAILDYGVLVYLIFLASFLFAVGLVGGFVVTKTIDTGPKSGVAVVVVIDLLPLSLFAVQHSVIARPFFKRWRTRVIPAAAERSTYVLASSLLLFLLFWQWRPLPHSVWAVNQPALAGVFWALFGLGWHAGQGQWLAQ